ncbi:hypothetical protein AMELA_G00233240, partial [Ameiurus melas]
MYILYIKEEEEKEEEERERRDEEARGSALEADLLSSFLSVPVSPKKSRAVHPFTPRLLPLHWALLLSFGLFLCGKADFLFFSFFFFEGKWVFETVGNFPFTTQQWPRSRIWCMKRRAEEPRCPSASWSQ